MKYETVWKSLTDIRDEYVEEAAPDNENAANEPKMAKKRLQKRVIGWGALAASLVIVAVAAYPIVSRLVSDDTAIADDAYADYPTRPMKDYEVITPNLAWVYMFEYEIDGKTERLAFPAVEWEGETYSLTCTDNDYVTIPAEQMGEALGEVEVTAYSHHNPVSAILSATLYACEGIDPAYGVVVKLEGVDEYYLYRSGRYAETLDELVEKANYRDLLTVSPNIFHYTVNGKGEPVYLVFEGMTTDILWNELLAYGETVDYEGDADYYLSVSIGHELLQYRSTLCISADGYVTFGALKAGRAVYVGRERARAFLDYLEDNLTGYRLVEEVDQSLPQNESPGAMVTVTSAPKEPDTPQ